MDLPRLELRDLDETLVRGVEAAYALLSRNRSWFASLSTRADDLAQVSIVLIAIRTVAPFLPLITG